MSEKSSQTTEELILKTAINISSLHGLEGLTIGQLANAMSMSKSGVFAYFGSKEQMQLNILDKVVEIFIEEVIHPARTAQSYMLIWNYCDRWLGYIERDVFPGGCFVLSAASEFIGHSGIVHDKVVKINQDWVTSLGNAVQQAIDNAQLSPELDVEQLVFELNALTIGANWAYKTLSNQQATQLARRAIWQRLNDFTITDDALPPN